LFVFRAGGAGAVAAVSWGEAVDVVEIASAADCQSLRRGHVHVVTDDVPAQDCAHFRGAPPRGYACIPLNAQGEAIGVLHVQWHDAAYSLAAGSVVQIAKDAAHHRGLALATLALREKRQQQAIHDALTGLYNRRYIEQRLESE